MTRTITIIESPYAGAIEDNETFLAACLHDSIVFRHEAPFASHGLYTRRGVLRDDVPAERALGIEAGLTFYTVAQRSAVYLDRGLSSGMRAGIARARERMVPVSFRMFPFGTAHPSVDVELTMPGDAGSDPGGPYTLRAPYIRLSGSPPTNGVYTATDRDVPTILRTIREIYDAARALLGA